MSGTGEPLYDDVGSVLITDQDGAWEATICVGEDQTDLPERHVTPGAAVDAAVAWGKGRGLLVLVPMLTIRKPNEKRIAAWKASAPRWYGDDSGHDVSSAALAPPSSDLGPDQ